jgi:hypothetical protein
LIGCERRGFSRAGERRDQGERFYRRLRGLLCVQIGDDHHAKAHKDDDEQHEHPQHFKGAARACGGQAIKIGLIAGRHE